VALFLAAVISLPANDPKPLSHMWFMAFASAGALGGIIFGAWAKKKEPKDHALPLIIISSIILTLSILMALTSLA
jgi:hypothetical protein